MLSPSAVAYFSPLKYRADAARRTSWLPLSGICWEDELPNFQDLMHMPEPDQRLMARLFCIRIRIWKGEAVSDEDRSLWEDVHSQLPDWAFFQRLTISAEDQKDQTAAEQAGECVFEGLAAVFSDECTITQKGGVAQFSATWKVPEEKGSAKKKQHWWRRIF